MKSVLLLFAKVSVNRGDADPERLASLLSEASVDVQVTWAFFDDLLFSLDETQASVLDTRNNHQLEDYSAIYFRYWGEQQGHAIATARFCKLKHIPFVDSEVLRTGSQNKLTQYLNLFEAKIPFPRTLMGPGKLLIERFNQHGFTFPLIMKSVGGTRGRDNYLVQNQTDMQTAVAAHADTSFVLQEFIPNDGDYRVLVVGNEVKLLIERRAAEGSHLNNTSQGGSAQLVAIDTLPPEVLKASVTAAAFFGRQIAGVDMLHSTFDGKYYCLEVNRAPQIEAATFETEKAKILAEYLANLN